MEPLAEGELDEILMDGIDANEPHAMEILALARRMLLAVSIRMGSSLTDEEFEVACIRVIKLAREEWKDS
jgi:hypothetical protein